MLLRFLLPCLDPLRKHSLLRLQQHFQSRKSEPTRPQMLLQSQPQYRRMSHPQFPEQHRFQQQSQSPMLLIDQHQRPHLCLMLMLVRRNDQRQRQHRFRLQSQSLQLVRNQLQSLHLFLQKIQLLGP